MKFYFAGGETFGQILDSVGVKHLLLSFYYLPKEVKNGRVNVFDYYGRDKEIFLDSGAYTVFHQGGEVNIEDYAKFIQTHGVKIYANLDSIESWEQSKANQKFLESQGLTPLPCWHANEPFSVLKDIISSYEYVGIGTSHKKSTVERSNIVSSFFEEFPKTKFHMFAVTTPATLIDYPFYSVDSTTWLNSGKYGALITIDGYLLIGSGKDNTESGKHFNNLPRAEQAKWQTYFQLQGFNIQTLLTDYNERLRASAKYFLALEAAINTLATPKKSKKVLDSFLNVQQLRRKIWCLLKKKS